MPEPKDGADDGRWTKLASAAEAAGARLRCAPDAAGRFTLRCRRHFIFQRIYESVASGIANGASLRGAQGGDRNNGSTEHKDRFEGDPAGLDAVTLLHLLNLPACWLADVFCLPGVGGVRSAAF